MLTNKDIDTMIKMENLIGMNERKLFGRNKNKVLKMDGYEVTHEDFTDFMNIIERILYDRDKRREKAKQTMAEKRKTDKTYGRPYTQKQ